MKNSSKPYLLEREHFCKKFHNSLSFESWQDYIYEMYNSDDAAKFETAKQKYIDYVQKLTVQEFFISTKEDLMAIALDCQYHNKDKLKHVLD